MQCHEAPRLILVDPGLKPVSVRFELRDAGLGGDERADQLLIVVVSSQVEFPAGTQVARVYVPESYNPANPPGLLIFVNSSDTAYLPSGYYGLLERMNLIGGSPEKIGNNRHDPWRIARTLDLTVSLMDEYNVDPNRVYVAGSSGGALIAVMCALLYPDLYTGCVPNAHGFPRWDGNYASVWPEDEFRAMLAQGQRFGWLFGEDDDGFWFFARSVSDWRRYEATFDYYAIPGVGHGKPAAENLEAALRYVDAAVQASRTSNFADWTAESFRRIDGSYPDSHANNDADSDGRGNLEEFLFGGDPRVADTLPQPASMDRTDFVLECRHPLSDIDFVLETSPDLQFWSPAGPALSEANPVGSVLDRPPGSAYFAFATESPNSSSSHLIMP